MKSVVRFLAAGGFIAVMLLGFAGISGAWTISTVDSGGTWGTDNSIKTDLNNRAHISYYDAADHSLKYATNVSGSWITTTVDNAGDVGRLSSIALDRNNHVHISYIDFTANNTSQAKLKYATNAPGYWVVTVVDPSTGGGIGCCNSSIAIDSNNNVHICYMAPPVSGTGPNFTGGYLKYATNAPGYWAITTVDYNTGTACFSSIALDRNNKAHISYTDMSLFKLKYATNEYGSWIVTTLDDNNSFGSIALDSYGNSYISYNDANTGAIKCATNASGSWTIATIDAGQSGWSQSSIAIDYNNKAHISYQATGSWPYAPLKYATNTSGSWTIDTVDGNTESNADSSITIDSHGYAHISYYYYDGTNYSLNYATNAQPVYASSYLYIANGNNTVAVIDTVINSVVRIITVGNGAMNGVINPAGTQAYVPNMWDNTTSVIDTTTNMVVATISGAGGCDVAFNPSGSMAYVGNMGGYVYVIDTSTNTVVAAVPVGAGAMEMAVNPAGTRLYVANAGDSTVSVIDTSTNTVVATMPVGSGTWGNAMGVAIDPSGSRVYVAGGNGTAVIDTATNTVVSTIAANGMDVVVNPYGPWIYIVGCDGTSVVDTTTNTVVTTISGAVGMITEVRGNLPWPRVYVEPIYGFGCNSSYVYVIDTATNTVVATVNINSANTDTTPPTSYITAPANGATLTGASYTITGVASDNPGGSGVRNVEVGIDGAWRQVSDTSGNGSFATWAYNWTPTPFGNHSITSRATDNAGNMETPSWGVNVAVNSTGGTVWEWGGNTAGQLGIGAADNNPHFVPSPVNGLTDVTSIVGDYWQTIALRSNGTVWTWGLNDRGQLGDGTTIDRYAPVQVIGLSGVVAVGAGMHYSLAVRNDGTVWAWGANDMGQLGDGTTTDRYFPVQVVGLTGVVAVTTMDEYITLALKSDGTVWQWGDGSSLVQVSGLNNVVAVAGTYDVSVALKSDGTVWEWYGTGTPAIVNGLSNVTAIASCCGSLALKSDGTVWEWDSRSYYGAATPVQVPGLSDITAITICCHSMALKSDGTVWAWGNNGYGQLGDGTTNYSQTPVQVAGLSGVAGIAVGEFHSIALRGAGGGNTDAIPPTSYITAPSSGATLTGTNATITGVSSDNPGGSGVRNVEVSIDGAWQNTTDTSGNGSFATWAYNWTPTPFGNHSITSRATDNAGNVETPSWGINVTVANNTPTTGGTVWAWGSNTGGQLGNGVADYPNSVPHPNPAQVSGLSGVVAAAGGVVHTIALKSDGTVWAWGHNVYGQLGDGTTTDRYTPVQVSGLTGVTAVACGWLHSIALKSDGTVWTWGHNYNGQLGDGTTTDRYTPVQVSGLSGVTAIAAKGDFTVALKSDGTVWTWGFGIDGATDRHTPVQVGLTGVTAIACGIFHTVALKSDGTVWAWGSNGYGQLGFGTPGDALGQVVGPSGLGYLTGVTAISAGETHSIALKSDGTVWAWGGNDSGQLGIGTASHFYPWFPAQVSGLSGITAIAAGDRHSVALRQDGTVWAWGNNDAGQLGDGTTTDRYISVQVSGLTEIVAIAGGAWHTIAIQGGAINTDTTPPTSIITAPATGSTLTGTSYTITGTASDNPGGSGVQKVEVSIDGAWHNASDASGNGSFATWAYNWTPLPFGNHSITSRATDNAGNVEAPGRGVTVTVSTPNNTGFYTMTNAAYNWIEIAASGNNTGIYGDDSYGSANIGFTFNYNGNSYNTLYISTNGYASFISNTMTAYTNTNIPNISYPNALIAPFWDDLVVDSNNSKIYSATIGTAPNRIFVTEWQNARLYSGSNYNLTFEILLYEGSNKIAFQYYNTFTDSGSATVGLEDASGTTGVQYEYNTANLTPNFALEFDMSAAPAAGPSSTIMSPSNNAVISGASYTIAGTATATAGTTTSSYAYISNEGSNNVSVIDLSANSVVATVGVGSNPDGIAVNPAGTRVYVANLWSNSVSIIDTSTNSVIATVGVGSAPDGVAINPSGTRVYVTNLLSGNISVIDTSTNAVIATVGVGSSPDGIVINPAGTRAYVTNRDSNNVSVIDTSTNAVSATIGVGTYPDCVAVNPADTRVYVTNGGSSGNTVSVIDTSTNSVVATVGVGSWPQGVVVNPSGTRLYVANAWSGNVSVIDTSTNSVIATIGVGSDPIGVAVNQAGTRAYVANRDSNNVSVIDTSTNTVITMVGVGTWPIATGQFIGGGSAQSGVQKVEVSTDGGSTWQLAIGTTSWSYTWTLPANGNYIIQSRSTDNAGNIETPGPGVTVTVNNDNAPPSSTITTPTNGATLTGTSYTITGIAADNPGGSGVQKVEVSTDGGNTWYIATGTTSWSCNWTLPANGSYTITARATDNAGNVETPGGGGIVTISNPLPTSAITAPTNGATLTGTTYTITGTATAAGGATTASYAYIPNADSNNVSVIDTSTNSVIATIGVGVWPHGVAVNQAATRVYVVNALSNNISVIDTSTNSVIAAVPVGSEPLGVAVNPAGTRVYVTNNGSSNVSVIDTSTNSVIATVGVGSGPEGVAINPAGTKVYVTNYFNDNISIIDTSTNTVVTTIGVGSGPSGVAVNPAGTRVYVTNFRYSSNSVSVIDTSTNTVVATIPVGSWPEGIVVNPAGTRVYVTNWNSNNVSVIDTSTNFVVATVADESGPVGIAIIPDGTRIYVANMNGNNVSVIDTSTNSVIVTIEVGSGPRALGQFIGVGSTSSGVQKVEVSTDGGSTWNLATGTTNWSYTWTLPANGSYTIQSRATDNIGNVETPGAGVNVTIGNTAPGNGVEVVDPATGTGVTFTTVAGGGNTTVTTSSTGSTPPIGWMLGTPPVYYDVTTTASFSGPVQVCIHYDAAEFPNGSTLALFHWDSRSSTWNNVTTSVDTQNNIICGASNSLSPFVVLVLDTTPPVITVPPNKTFEATAVNTPLSSADYGAATATDAVGIREITNNAPAAFPLGDTIITWTATDTLGNTSSGRQTITIVDTTPPVLTVPAGIHILLNTPTTAPAITSFFAGASAYDLVDGNVVVSSNQHSSYNTPGPIQITFMAVDNHGNKATQSSWIYVEYAFGGFLSPVSLNKPFKLGSTIPLKFQLKDYAGNIISNATPALMIQRYANGVPDGDPIEVNSAADNGGMFRYDQSSQQYICNLSTKGLSTGSWMLLVSPGDGTARTGTIYLK